MPLAGMAWKTIDHVYSKPRRFTLTHAACQQTAGRNGSGCSMAGSAPAADLEKHATSAHRCAAPATPSSISQSASIPHTIIVSFRGVLALGDDPIPLVISTTAQYDPEANYDHGCKSTRRIDSS